MAFGYSLKHLHDERSDYISEFFADIKNTKFTKLFTPLLLGRRMLFVIIILVMQPFGKKPTFILMVCIQVPYVIYLLIARPYESPKDNFIEVMNEFFYCLFLLIFWTIDSEQQWTPAMIRV